MIFQKCVIEVDMIYLKQASEKWNLSSESEKLHKTEIWTCGTDWKHFIHKISSGWNMWNVFHGF